ncbi:hypothetical protein LY76DRAFT_109463 [Colletotrichum caudatum]|nr:hypothetical protein LY76DRAFT_109463 [Colletotrichum caudatum]
MDGVIGNMHGGHGGAADAGKRERYQHHQRLSILELPTQLISHWIIKLPRSVKSGCEAAPGTIEPEHVTSARTHRLPSRVAFSAWCVPYSRECSRCFIVAGWTGRGDCREMGAIVDLLSAVMSYLAYCCLTD